MPNSSHEKRPGVVAGLAYRPVDGDAMAEISHCSVEPGRGIVLENRKPGNREITLIAAETWQDVCRELEVELPWHARRANVLTRGLDLSAAIGQKLAIGTVVILVHGETKPCGIMDQQFDGLKKALGPDFRGGVYGQVLTAGTIRIGTPIEFLRASRPE